MRKSIKTIFKQGIFYPKNFVAGRVKKTTASLDSLKFGEGAIVEVNGDKVAAYKNEEGKVVTLSPVCRHLGCIVGWNSDEKTWDCPCHGSRYEADGKLKQGPAKADLKPVKIFIP